MAESSHIESVAQLEALADKGDLRASAILSIKLRIGDGVRIDEKKAFALAKKAADAGNPIGMAALAAICIDGIGTEKDETRGSELYAKALTGLRALAQGGDPWAEFCIGVAYLNGAGVTMDQKLATEWLDKSAKKGLALAQNALGQTSGDERKAVEMFEKAAAQGCAPAMVNLGIAFSEGTGVPKDEKRAFEHFQRAADAGDVSGQQRVGMMYSSGSGVQMDKRKAAEYYRLAAERGFPDSQNSLGVLYSTGVGVSEDHHKAVEWFEKAASQGNVNAQVNLASAYENGLGLAQDDQQAAYWYERAALLGDPIAQIRLSTAYETGKGRPKDQRSAFDWMVKAANQGVGDAEFAVAMMYRSGVGVQKDEEKSAQWLEKAASHGSSDAQRAFGGIPVEVPVAAPDRKKMIEYLVVVDGDASRGSGSIIRLKGNSLIVTNAHVLSGNEAISFRLLDSTRIATGTIGLARGYDLAVLTQSSIEGGLDTMPEIEKNVALGDEVVVLGNSKGSGVVTEIPGKVTGIGPDLIEVDAKFVAGNSGSPIIHVKTGKVIGIATYTENPDLDAPTKDSKFAVVRRFGYRLDTVQSWEFPTWERFSWEAKQLAVVERKSRYLATLLGDIRDDGAINGSIHQDDNHALQTFVAAYLQVRNAPPPPVPVPRPVQASDIEAWLREEQLPGESTDAFFARRVKLKGLGLIGVPRLGMSEGELQVLDRQQEQRRQAMVRQMQRDAEAQAIAVAEAEAQRLNIQIRAAYKAAKVQLLRQLAAEAIADIDKLDLSTFCGFHGKKLTEQKKLREVLRRKFEEMISIQDSRPNFTLP